MWIEIFRTGTHTDSAGRRETYSPEMLDNIAQTYNSYTASDGTWIAPVVKGHPGDDAPAYGWVERLARKGSVLMAKLKEVDNGFVEEVRNGRYRKISVSFYPNLLLRHVGFLGAATPAVSGLKNVMFSEVEHARYEFDVMAASGSILQDEPCPDDNMQTPKLSNKSFSAAEHVSESEIAALRSDNEALKTKLDSLEKDIRLKHFRDFANSLIENPAGAIITPAQADDLVEILESAYRSESFSQENNFMENEGVNRIKSFMSALKPVFSMSEFAGGTIKSYRERSGFEGRSVRPDRLRLHEKALELQEGSMDMSYEEAVELAAKT